MPPISWTKASLIALFFAIVARKWTQLNEPLSLKEETSKQIIYRRRSDSSEIGDVNEESIAEAMESLSWFETNAKRASIPRPGGVAIEYAVFTCNNTNLSNDDNNTVIVIFPGWSELMHKWSEFVRHLLEKDHVSHVVVMDHRSQGLSGPPRPQGLDSVKTHVDSFDELLLDAEILVEQVARPLGKRIVTLGFSMGGLVGSHLAVKRPDLSSELVLICPALLIKTKYPTWILLSILRVLKMLGFGQSFVPGHPIGGGSPSLNYPPYSTVTSSVAKTKLWEHLRQKLHGATINGMSVSHVLALLSARIDSKEEYIKLTKTRILLLSVGKDSFVDNAPMFALSNQIQCRHVHIEDARHELMQEREELRSIAFKEIDKFLQR